MASTAFQTLLNQTLSASPTNGGKVSLQPSWVDFVASLKATSVGTSVDADIEHSPDGGTTWLAVGSFTQLTADGTGELQITTNLFPNVRVAASFVGGSPDVECKLFYREAR